MKTVVVLFVLILTLIGGAAAGKLTAAEERKIQEDTCNTLCLDKKQLKEPSVCKEACAIKESFKAVWIEASKCSLKCVDQHGGVATPAAKSCDEGCKKKYDAKATEANANCDAVCSKVKGPLGIEECKKICNTTLILQEIQMH